MEGLSKGPREVDGQRSVTHHRLSFLRLWSGYAKCRVETVEDRYPETDTKNDIDTVSKG